MRLLLLAMVLATMLAVKVTAGIATPAGNVLQFNFDSKPLLAACNSLQYQRGIFVFFQYSGYPAANVSSLQNAGFSCQRSSPTATACQLYNNITGSGIFSFRASTPSSGAGAIEATLITVTEACFDAAGHQDFTDRREFVLEFDPRIGSVYTTAGPNKQGGLGSWTFSWKDARFVCRGVGSNKFYTWDALFV